MRNRAVISLPVFASRWRARLAVKPESELASREEAHWKLWLVVDVKVAGARASTANAAAAAAVVVDDS